MKIRLLFMGLLLVLSAVGASAQDVANDQARCFTTWDDAYLYMAVRVDSPDIVATHVKPNESIGGDDGVSVYIETTGNRPESVGPTCARMDVSAAGGAQFLVGTKDGKFEPKTAFVFKFGTSVQGTINNSDDIDMGYQIELAIPWMLMNAQPPTNGSMLGFNVVVHRRGGDFVSIAPKVKTEADLLSSAKWSKLVLAPFSFVVATTDIEKIISARYVVRAPLINGLISDKEWHASTSFVADLPMPAGTVYEAKFPAQKTVLATYALWSQPGKQSAASWRGDHPIKNFGPWSGAASTQYHKDELSDAVAAGVDVMLAGYGGSAEEVGLAHLVAAVDELKSEGKPYPRIGLQLPPQVSQDSVYALIKSFYSRVPVDYRATGQAGKPRNGRMGCVVCSRFVTAGEVEELSTRFEKDFGCPLVFVGGESSAVRVQSVEPLSRVLQSAVASYSRMGGKAYDENWAAVYNDKPSWVLCSSWNEVGSRSELCATREYGRKYIDATTANTRRFKGALDYDAQFVRYNVPTIVPAKQFAMAEFEIRNAGNLPWKLADSYAVGYRWYRGGRFYGESKIRRPLDRDVAPGESITVQVGIATVNAAGAAMPDGPCEARIELVRMSDGKWLTSMGDQPLVVPITVGQTPAWAASWITGHAPAMIAAGQNYGVRVRVRNDGSQPWPKGVCKLGCALTKVDGATGAVGSVPIKPISAFLAKDCKPGEIGEFGIDLNLIGADKKAIPAWKPGDSWTYQVVFDIYNGQKWLSELGTPQLKQSIAVFENDYGARVVDCGLGAKVDAGKTLDTKVVVRNIGRQMWDKKRVKLGYHWYHLDGAEMLWDGATTPIPSNVMPGMPLVMTAKVTTPKYDGQYVLVWDMQIDGVWQSTQPLTRGGCTLPVFVEVTGGRLGFADLAALYDTCSSSPDSDPSAGDFDGKGSGFPAEFMPPDASVSDEASRVYPTGYQINRDPQPDGRISFYYPGKAPGAKNAIACDAQKVTVDQGQYRVLHILGASSDGDALGDITLNYSGGDQTAKLQMSDWTAKPKFGEKIGIEAGFRRNKDGVDPIPVRLFDYTIPLDPAKTLASVTLPKNAKMKVVAVTLEK